MVRERAVRGQFPLNLPLEVRFLGHSKAYMAPYSTADPKYGGTGKETGGCEGGRGRSIHEIGYVHVGDAECGGRIGKARASRVEDRTFDFWSSQTSDL